jgi:hypothetical protein
MARPLRIEYIGALYHITARGNERNPIYREEGDYQENRDRHLFRRYFIVVSLIGKCRQWRNFIV